MTSYHNCHTSYHLTTFSFKNDNNLRYQYMTPTKPLHRFRIKQPGRTIHISSAVDPSQWHVHSRDTVYALQKISDNPISDRSTRRTNPVIPSRDPVERRRENAVHQVSNSKPSSARTRILFYHKNDPYYGFTNFSPHPVMDGGKRYPTSEHLFQASKVRDASSYLVGYCSLRLVQFLPHRPDLAERIRNCASPRDALSMARSNQNAVRADWKKVNIRMVYFNILNSLDRVKRKAIRWI